MFWIFLRTLAQYQEIFKVIGALYKEVPELEAIINIFTKVQKNPSQLARKKIYELLRKLTPEKIKSLQKRIGQLSKMPSFVDSFNKEVNDSDVFQKGRLIDISNIRIPLNSSWLAYGIFIPEYSTKADKEINSGHGSLEWATKDGYGPYYTPDVSFRAWDAMVLSMNHAGKVGWDYGVFNRDRRREQIVSRFNVRKKRIKRYKH